MFETSCKPTILKILKVFLGTMSLGLGCYFLSLTDLGGDALFSLQRAIQKTFQLTFPDFQLGMATIILNLLFFGLMFLTGRKLIGPSTFIVALFSGWSMVVYDEINKYLNILPKVNGISVHSFMVFLLGLILISYGIATYVGENFGVAPFENVVVFQARIFRITFGMAKIISDIEFIVLALIINSIVSQKPFSIFGYGTIVASVLTGPLVEGFSFYKQKFPDYVAIKRKTWYNIQELKKENNNG